MGKANVKWLLAGLIGACCSLVLVAGGALALFSYFGAETNADNGVPSGEEEWEADVAAHNETVAKIDAEILRLGLNDVYEIEYLFDDTRWALYTSKDYALVEERLEAARANAKTPMEKHRYSQVVEAMGELNHNEVPDELLATLDAWVAHSPQSHYPWLIRGVLALEIADYYRGSAWAHEVSADGMRKYVAFNEQAREDLLKASSLMPTDPEPFAFLVSAAAGSGGGMADMQRYFNQTLALNPHHFNVRWTMMNYSQPQWFGSWAELERRIAEAEVASKEFPELMGVSRIGHWFMTERASVYEDEWESDATDAKWATAYVAQAEQSPDDLHAQGNAAYYAGYAKDYVTAAKYFLKLGNRYPTGSEYDSVIEFHEWRLFTLGVAAADDSIVGTPQERACLDVLAACASKTASYNELELAYLTRQRDDAKTRAFYETYTQGYFNTGNWGDPPDYRVMEAMAKAGRSDNIGIQGTEKERILLEEALELAPDNPYVRLVHAEHFITNKAYDEARIHLEKAREIDATYLPAMHIMGWLNYHQKRWDDGIASANEFLNSGPSDYLTENEADAREILELCEKKKAREDSTENPS